MNPVMNQYKMSSPAERARLRVVYALLGTVFFMPVNLIAMEICLALAVVFAVCLLLLYHRAVRPVVYAGHLLRARPG